MWMEGVKIIFGLVMLGLALYTAQPLFSPKVYDIVFPSFLILSGIYLILIDRKAVTAPTYTRIKYSIAIAFIIFGSMNLHFEEKTTASGKLEWQMLSSQAQIDGSVSKSGGKPTLIDFYADWCAQCKELDKYTYIDPKVIELSKKFNVIKIDLTKGDKEIESKFKILGLPVVAFMDKNGKEIESLRITGFLKPEEFVKVMEKALSN
jgi:thiol:disulfide interchange protein DsbD